MEPLAADRIEARRAQLQALLWPAGEKPLSVWAVLDGARDPAVYAALLESRLEFRCLYERPIPRELERVAPQLVELLPGHRLTNRLLGPAWGQAWGVFLRIEDPSNLRHHLRKLLKVKTEEGRTLLFRYYDPRVLRVFLPTCEDAQLQAVFGSVANLVMEAAEDSAAWFMSCRGGQLVARRVPLLPNDDVAVGA